MMNDELMDRARELLALRDKAPLTFSESWEHADDMADTIRDLMARCIAAESRLCKLASAEPVAWVDGEYFVWPKGKRRPSNCDALIRRPEMPS